MTTVTLPTVPPPPESRSGTGRLLPRPGRYTVAPGRSLAELTAWYGPLPTRRRRVPLSAASLTVSAEAEHPEFRFEFDGTHLTAALTSERIDRVRGRLQLTGDLDLNDVGFPVLLRLRVVERADDRLLVVGTARLPYRLLRRATGFRLPWHLPATRLRLLVAAEFA
ncbi:hypothetical protein [Streptomyces sp. NBC_00038]|uniref:hypothetical protein n=1 Tax=Streptomyces sp. NBC_00038 TaxID=2903615 RepID=UPI00225051C4|nr:hypothetical protein [Streptomyces sp. NBC_00038]MCX5558207.1 hypothetical protein [Streptomyces sp. NBC_00038]